jgi:hypothetical protein
MQLRAVHGIHNSCKMPTLKWSQNNLAHHAPARLPHCRKLAVRTAAENQHAKQVKQVLLPFQYRYILHFPSCLPHHNLQPMLPAMPWNEQLSSGCWSALICWLPASVTPTQCSALSSVYNPTVTAHELGSLRAISCHEAHSVPLRVRLARKLQ